jgi:hypothetical protein
MKRLEVIANQSVKEELIAALEAALPGIQYTVLPMVHGKGGHKEKLGTRTWPETNFLIISYMGDSEAEKATEAVRDIVDRFPAEGLCGAFSDARLI